MKRILLCLYNMGGPYSVTDVKRFLTELFNDGDLLPFPGPLRSILANVIIKKRLEAVMERYASMGGASPQLSITESCVSKVKEGLSSLKLENIEIVDVVSSYRYCHPKVSSVLEKAQLEVVDEVWFFSLYPHCSQSTTGSYLKTVQTALKKLQKKPKVYHISSYFEDVEFIKLWSQRIQKMWDVTPSEGRHLLVSAHSIPKSFVANGDPYKLQISKCAETTLKHVFRSSSSQGLLQNIDWSLCWQSSVGPIPWLGPSFEKQLETLKAQGIKNIIVWPISFVSDHIETLHEIDDEYALLAKEMGFESFQRIPNLNDHADFVDFIIHKFTNSLNAHSLGLKGFTLGEIPYRCRLQPGNCLCQRYFNALA